MAVVLPKRRRNLPNTGVERRKPGRARRPEHAVAGNGTLGFSPRRQIGERILTPARVTETNGSVELPEDLVGIREGEENE